MGLAGIVIQARMGSHRLPGKVLEPIRTRPLLGLLVERLARCRRVNRLVVATTTTAGDDPLVEWCEHSEVPVFRGSEADVLERYAACAQAFELSTVVRVTADNPLTDPDGIDALIAALERGGSVYAHNKHPRGYPVGAGAEAITAEALERLHRLAREPYDREHVTPYALRHPELFPTDRLDAPEPLQASDVVFTVDYPEDLAFLRRLDAMVPLEPDGSLEAYLRWVRTHPELAQINRHLHKGYEQNAQATRGR